MTGTLINAAGVIVGALLGIFLKRGIPARIRDSLMKVEGLAIVLIGLSSLLQQMLSVNAESGRLNCDGGMLLLISLVGGCLVGELARIDDRLNAAGMLVERRFKADGFSSGLVTASLVFCVGAMAVIGPINEGLTGDRSLLYIKTLLDSTTSVVLASVMGIGVLFSFVPILVVQGIPALLAVQLSPYITPELLTDFCMVGYALVTAIGVNFLVDAKIKIANLLPALLFPVTYHVLCV